ncbi:unnamed protein product [Caenorhabditis auriculariae]|uniref:Uncharacterized protein n=1 Tax=Caenorhabditis auriculariae TaxID=2777116 RepID=A0A8S1HG70_9PELO|nr:unnamed protein product [Caenorhabditis auriculariae]
MSLHNDEERSLEIIDLNKNPDGQKIRPISTFVRAPPSRPITPIDLEKSGIIASKVNLGTATTYFFQDSDPKKCSTISFRPTAAERGIDIESSKGYLSKERETSGLTLRPSISERGLPSLNDTFKERRPSSANFDDELKQTVDNRRVELEKEEQNASKKIVIRKAEPPQPYQKVHHYDGKPAQPPSFFFMDDLKNQFRDGDIDRIVKEKKTTTLTPTGAPKRMSITSSSVNIPPLLDRPYRNAIPENKTAAQEPISSEISKITESGGPGGHATAAQRVHIDGAGPSTRRCS